MFQSNDYEQIRSHSKELYLVNLGVAHLPELVGSKTAPGSADKTLVIGLAKSPKHL